MIPVLLYPGFDPVLIQVGPIAIRWYALAYIGSLVIGWRIMSLKSQPGGEEKYAGLLTPRRTYTVR